MTLLTFEQVERVRSQQGVRECEGPPHNDISSFPASVHAPGFRLSAKVTKVEGCAWLDAHQSPDRSHSQRISNRGESYITFSLSGLYGNFRVSQRELRHGSGGGRRGAFCGIEELRAVPHAIL